MFDEIFKNTGNTKSFSKGAILQSAGQKLAKAFYVKKGLLKSYIIDEQGKEHIFMFASEGWIASDIESQAFNNETVLFIEAIENSEANELVKKWRKRDKKLYGKKAKEISEEAIPDKDFDGKVIKKLISLRTAENLTGVEKDVLWKDEFTKSNKNTVYVYSDFTNPYHNQKDFTQVFTFMYYRSDGSLLYSENKEWQISKDWPTVLGSAGISITDGSIGSPYRVELWTGDLLLKTTYFNIVE